MAELPSTAEEKPASECCKKVSVIILIIVGSSQSLTGRAWSVDQQSTVATGAQAVSCYSNGSWRMLQAGGPWMQVGTMLGLPREYNVMRAVWRDAGVYLLRRLDALTRWRDGRLAEEPLAKEAY